MSVVALYSIVTSDCFSSVPECRRWVWLTECPRGGGGGGEHEGEGLKEVNSHTTAMEVLGGREGGREGGRREGVKERKSE